MAQMLINNKQGGPLDAFRVSPGQLAVQRTAGTVVVHTAAVLLSMTNVTLLQPLISMITNPADLTVSITGKEPVMWVLFICVLCHTSMFKQGP